LSGGQDGRAVFGKLMQFAALATMQFLVMDCRNAGRRRRGGLLGHGRSPDFLGNQRTKSSEGRFGSSGAQKSQPHQSSRFVNADKGFACQGSDRRDPPIYRLEEMREKSD
jgi:hypothetical protein